MALHNRQVEHQWAFHMKVTPLEESEMTRTQWTEDQERRLGFRLNPATSGPIPLPDADAPDESSSLDEIGQYYDRLSKREEETELLSDCSAKFCTVLIFRKGR